MKRKTLLSKKLRAKEKYTVLHLFEKQKNRQPGTAAKRGLAAVLSAAVVVASIGGGTAAFAADTSSSVQPVCDETYYAMLDYYGDLQQGSVVKSYSLNGAKTISDTGTYDKVSNLTDDTKAQISGNKLTFDLSKKNLDHFYFEGTTSQPYSEMPWNIKMSYRLNGVSTKAEDLAGKTGLVEINIDVTAKKDSSIASYYKNNLVLAGLTAFNEDDIVSLEASGAQVQLLGNLRSVLFMVMPGESQHISIKVGSNAFTFSGMTYMAVPATLSQLSQVTDLKNAKNKTENSYQTIVNSLNTILNSVDTMGSSLNTAANGLDQLNQARATLSSGKSNVYQSVDVSLEDLNNISKSLQPLSGNLNTASSALSSVSSQLSGFSGSVSSLKQPLANCRSSITALQKDLSAVSNLAQNFAANSSSAKTVLQNLQNDADSLSSNLTSLKSQLQEMRSDLKQISDITGLGNIKLDGKTTAEIEQMVTKAQTLHAQYLAYLQKAHVAHLTFKEYLEKNGHFSAQQAALFDKLWNVNETQLLKEIQLAEAVNTMLGQVNGKIDQVNLLIGNVQSLNSSILSTVDQICTTMGDAGIGGQLKNMNQLLSNILNTVDMNKGDISSVTQSLNDLGNVAKTITQSADSALTTIDSISKSVNQYIPGVQQMISNCKTIVNSATVGLKDTSTSLKAMETLAKASGSNLDAGTQKTLQGLSSTLRSASKSLGQTDSIRSAENALTSLIDSEWNSHTGGQNNILLMDPNAKPVSLTSSQNSTPHSIQMVIRTQEIKESDAKTATDTTSTTKNTTFMQRVGNLFKGIWDAVAGVFVHK